MLLCLKLLRYSTQIKIYPLWFIRLLLLQDMEIFITLHKFSLIHSNPKRLIAILLVFIWLQSASLLSKSFNGLLRNMYINVKTIPIVNDLSDIVGTNKIDVFVNKYFYSNIGLFIKNMEDSEFKSNMVDLIDRANISTMEYQFENIYSTVILRRVIEGNAIAMGTTNEMLRFYSVFAYWRDKYTVARTKYLRQTMNFAVPKDHVAARMMNFWQVTT